MRGTMSYDEHQAMWPQMIAALAAIDEALGLPADGCNSLAQTLAKIRNLRAAEDKCNSYIVDNAPIPERLLDIIGRYGNARSGGCDEAEIIYRWEELCGSIKQYVAAERERCASLVERRAGPLRTGAYDALISAAAAIRGA